MGTMELMAVIDLMTSMEGHQQHAYSRDVMDVMA